MAIYFCIFQFTEDLGLSISWLQVLTLNYLPVVCQDQAGDDSDKDAGEMIADKARVSSPLTVSLFFPLARFVNAKHIVNSWSTREFRIVRLLVNGLTQKHLTAKLKISPETVRSQSQTIFYKLRSNNLLQGALPALRK